MMKSRMAVWLGVCWLLAVLPAGADVVTRVFVIGDADPHQLEEAVKATLSPQGKTVLLPDKGKLLVQDEAEYLPMAEAIVAQFAAPRPNVRIDLMFDESGERKNQGAVVKTRDGKIHVEALDLHSATSGYSNQFLVVQSGRSSVLRVVQEVPFIDFWYAYASQYGYLEGVARTRWRSIGSQLAVTPRVRGNLIEVEIMPQLSVLVDARYEVIDCREMKTIVTVANGQTVDIGGVAGGNLEFSRNFFQGASGAQSRMTNGFRLKATIMD